MLGTNIIFRFFKNRFSDLSKKCLTCIVRSYKRTCPHISDFEPFASMYYFSGLHNYRTFYLLIRINEIFNINNYKKIYIVFNTDKYDFKTDEIVINKKNRIYIDLRVDIKIRQCDETLNINLFSKKLTKKIHIGEMRVDVNSNVVMKSFPKNQWFLCFKDGQEVCKVQMSFYKIQKYACPNECMLIQDGLEIWKRESNILNKKDNKKKINFLDIHKNFDDDDENLSIINLDTDINDISLMQKLRLISFVLEQEIYVFDLYAYVPKYMSAKEIMGEWFICFLCFKNNKEDENINIETIIERNIHRDINIPMASIIRIVIDNKDNTNANIIYSYESVRYNLCIHSKKHLSYIIDAITFFTNELKILKESYGTELEQRKNRMMKENNITKFMDKRRVSSPRFRKNLPKSANKMINEMYLEKNNSKELESKKEVVKDELI